MAADLNKITSDYNAGLLSGRQKEIAEELGRRGVINIRQTDGGYSAPPEQDGGYLTSSKPEAFGRGLYSGAIELGLLPVSAVEGVLRAGNVGLQALGAPEQIRLPVSEKGLAGTIRSALKKPGYTYESMSEISPSARPYAVGGEVVGGSLLPAAAPLALAKSVPATGKVAATAADLAGDVGAVRQIGRQIVESAAQSPKSFLATEAALAGGSAVGAGVAETVAPSNVTARLIGELAPVVSPVVLFSRVVPNTVNKLLDITAPINPIMAKKRAGDAVKKLASEYGENPDVIAKSLLSESASEVDTLTAAQLTDSTALTALEKYLIGQNADIGKTYKDKAQQSAEKINNLYRQALVDGDSSKVFLAAQEKKEYLNNLLSNRIARAEDKAAKFLKPITGARPESEISVEAREIIESALKDARSTETELWDIIPKDIDVVPSNLSLSLRKYKSEILDERMLPSPTEAFANRVARVEAQNVDEDLVKSVFGEFNLNDVAPANEYVSTGDLLDFRKVALRKARQLRSGANPDYDTARIMQGLADSALDDLSVIPGNQVDIAREFSYQLNNKFGKTFAADILGVSSRGRTKVEPELTLRKTMATGGPSAEVRARQLEEAVTPISGTLTDDAIYRPQEMRNAQKDFLFLMASLVKNPRTQEFDASRLSKFIADNSANIKRLGLEDTFRDIESSRKAFETSLSVRNSASAFFDKKKIASKILKAGEEGVDKFIAKTINTSTNKTKDLRDLFRLVSGNKDAVKGLRASIFENIIDNGFDPASGVLTGSKIKGYLNQVSVGDVTLKEALIKSGAISPEQMQRINVIASKADRLNTAIKSQENASEFLQKEGLISRFIAAMTRAIGARLGAQSPMAKGTGAQLVFASEGSKLAREIALISPKVTIDGVLAEAMFNPKLMAELLKSPKSGTFKLKTKQQIEAYLIQAGLIEKESNEE